MSLKSNQNIMKKKKMSLSFDVFSVVDVVENCESQLWC